MSSFSLMFSICCDYFDEIQIKESDTVLDIIFGYVPVYNPSFKTSVSLLKNILILLPFNKPLNKFNGIILNNSLMICLCECKGLSNIVR